MVSAVLLMGDCNVYLSTSIMICKMPMPMQNWKIAPYSSACDHGLIGAGKYIPVEGTWARVKLPKNETIASQRLAGR